VTDEERLAKAPARAQHLDAVYLLADRGHVARAELARNEGKLDGCAVCRASEYVSDRVCGVSVCVCIWWVYRMCHNSAPSCAVCRAAVIGSSKL